jgi:hypothetical protein
VTEKSSTKTGAQKGSFVEALGQQLQALGGMMALPDADIDFVQKLQTVLAVKIRQIVNHGVPMPAGAGGQGSPPSAAGGPGGQPQGQPGGQPMMAGPPGSAGQGVSPLTQPPNPDELRRMIGAGAGQ